MKTLTKAALGLGGAAAVTAAAATGLSYLILKEGLDREEPRAMVWAKGRMLAGGKRRGASVPEALPPLLPTEGTERVEITAWDGVKLVGHWRPAPEPKRVLLAMHGWRGAWNRDFAGVAEFWRQSGCSVLYAEQRAQGESGGDYLGFGALERWDCRNWLDWLNAHKTGDLPVYLAGISMGATTVLLAAGTELPGNVRGIMADCGFTSPEDIWRQVAHDSFHMPYSLFRPLIHRYSKEKAGYAPDCCSTEEALRRTKLPVLLVHGEADAFVPPEMSRRNYAACAGPARLLTVPGARHGMSYLVDRERYEAAVLDFWQEFDS